MSVVYKPSNLRYLFTFFQWLCWVFIATCWLSLVAVSGSYSSLGCVGFSLQWLCLWSRGSRVPGPSSYGAWAYLPHSTWDLPWPGIEPVTPALVGGFLTTGPSGKFHVLSFYSSPNRTMPPSTCHFLPIWYVNDAISIVGQQGCPDDPGPLGLYFDKRKGS